MKIGAIDLGERPVVLAPMEDVTDMGFRLMCKQMGASMVYSEFVSADALIRSVNKSVQKLTIHPDERPVAIQIYGRDVDSMVEAAKIVEQATCCREGRRSWDAPKYTAVVGNHQGCG